MLTAQSLGATDKYSASLILVIHGSLEHSLNLHNNLTYLFKHTLSTLRITVKNITTKFNQPNIFGTLLFGQRYVT